jgi:hypothetical protein
MGAFVPPPGQPTPMQDGEFHSASQPSVVTWKLKDLDPPSPLYITRDDQIVVQGVSSSGGFVFTINGRLLTIDGTIVPLQATINTISATTAVTKLVTGVEGYLLSLSITATGQQRGVTYARAWLNRGLTALTNCAQLLVADYCTQTMAASWPGNIFRDPVEGPGELTSVQVSNPSAGLDWAFNPGASVRAQVYSVNAQLVTSAAVANRNVQVQIFDGSSHVVYQNSAVASIVASTTAQVTLTPGNSQAQVVTTDLTILLPSPCIIMPNGILQVLTVNLQAADQWSAIWLQVERWMQSV